MRQLFGAPSKTPIEAFYLESGKLPLRFIIQNRRLMYWFHLVKIGEDKMLHKFYKAQQNIPVKKDWTSQVEQDKKDLDINFSDDDIKQMSKYKF